MDNKITNKIKDLYVAEYSPDQECFHIHTVGEMQVSNIDIIKKKYCTSWLPIGIFNTRKEAYDFITECKKEFIRCGIRAKG